MVRYLAGGRYELDEAAPVDAGSADGHRAVHRRRRPAWRRWPSAARCCRAPSSTSTCRCSESVHLVTSVFFDVGVYVLVVGLVLDLLRSLGSEIDRHILREEHRTAPRSRSQDSRWQEAGA